MSPEIIIAFVVAAISGIVTAFSVPTLLSRLREVEQNISTTSTKVDVLWKIYAEDAITEARRAGLAKTNSPLMLTPKWHEVVSPMLENKILADIMAVTRITASEYDASIEVFDKYHDALMEVAKNHDVKLQALFGGIYHLAKTMKEKTND